MHSFGFLATMVVLLVDAGLIAEACMCMPEHPQQKFCQAKFVLKGTVIEDPNPQDNIPPQDNEWNVTEMVPRGAEKGLITYHVQVETVFKGQNGFSTNGAGIIEIKTQQSSMQCGNTKLQKGRAYLISGNNENGTLVINMCDWVVSYRDMTKTQRQSVRYFFKQNCQLCQITPCFNKEHCHLQGTNPGSCSYDMTHSLSGLSDCEGKHSRCIRSNNGKCMWARSFQMKECIKQRFQMEVNRHD